MGWSPLGWLCIRTRAAALWIMASRKASRGCTTARLSVPTVIILLAIMRWAESSITTRKTSRFRPRVRGRKWEATSAEERNRGWGTSFSEAALLPSSNAETMAAALAGPKPASLFNSPASRRDRARREAYFFMVSRPKSTALFPLTPVRRITASSSASVRLWGPFLKSLSRGRSPSGQPRIPLSSVNETVRPGGARSRLPWVRRIRPEGTRQIRHA